MAEARIIRLWEAGILTDDECETILLQLGIDAELVAKMIEQGPRPCHGVVWMSKQPR
jgi:hypothetical protein